MDCSRNIPATFPAAVAPDNRSFEPAPRETLMKLKLLIVDDDSLICSALARSLIRLGHAARAATCVESALRLVESESPTALLTDLDLGGGGDGIELIQRVRRGGRRLPTILMTGSDPFLARARLARAGLDDVALLEKPFEFEDLMKLTDALFAPAQAAAPVPTPVRAIRRTPVAAVVETVVRSLSGRVL
jgi:DNA-binding response OmpR family regulator